MTTRTPKPPKVIAPPAPTPNERPKHEHEEHRDALKKALADMGPVPSPKTIEGKIQHTEAIAAGGFLSSVTLCACCGNPKTPPTPCSCCGN